MSLEESIGTLLSYSLIKRSGKVDSFSIHPLVHSWARESRQERQIVILKQAFAMLQHAIYVPRQRTTDYWIFEQRVMLHIDAAAKHRKRIRKIGNVSEEDGMLAMSLGNVYRE